MNRTQHLLQHKESVLSFYCTAGFPQPEDTVPVLEALQEAGADMVEIGIPFSDPLADGPVIQQSNTIALQNGMSVQKLFQQLDKVRERVQIPLLLMGYLNPVLQFGIARFCRRAAACGIDGLIIPDLPLEEYRREWQPLLEQLKLFMVFLVTPTTPPERIREIDSLSGGFIYVVTSAATTGGGVQMDEQTMAYFDRLRQMSLKHPLIAGFGIRNGHDFKQVCSYTKGAIIGSGLIRHLQHKPALSALPEYVRAFRG